GDDHIDALLVDEAKAGLRKAHLHVAVLALHPDPAVVEVGEVTALRLVVRVGHVVSGTRGFARDLANAGHGCSGDCSWLMGGPAKSNIIAQKRAFFQLISLAF